MFKSDFTDVEEAGGARKAAPNGVYDLRIEEPEERKSRNEDNQVSMKVFIDSGTQKGVWFYHTVTFFSINPDGTPAKGAGFSKKFLKAIGKPHEGNVTVDGLKWKGLTFRGRIEQIEKTRKSDGKKFINNALVGADYWQRDDKDAPGLGTDDVQPVFNKSELKSVVKEGADKEVDSVPF